MCSKLVDIHLDNEHISIPSGLALKANLQDFSIYVSLNDINTYKSYSDAEAQADYLGHPLAFCGECTVLVVFGRIESKIPSSSVLGVFGAV